MKALSWNVNGLRAAKRKGLDDVLKRFDADFVAFQEIKMKPEQADFDFKGYHALWNSAVKPGYSGTLVLSKHSPLRVTNGLGEDDDDDEGRVITLTFPDFFFVTAYIPNAQRELTRLPFRMAYEDRFKAYLKALDEQKPVIVCGDLNVAHTPIDLKNPDGNQRNAGYTIEERMKFSALLEAGFVDVFRTLHPERIQYTWWSYRFNARKRNIGWRIDYFLVSERLMPAVRSMSIEDAIEGSDHCPIVLDIDV